MNTAAYPWFKISDLQRLIELQNLACSLKWIAAGYDFQDLLDTQQEVDNAFTK